MRLPGLAAFILCSAALPAAAASAAPAGGACKIAVAASADRSFAQAGYDSSPARLTALVALTRARFAAAARRLCAKGVLGPADLARFRKLVVQNGEGAAEPLIYQSEGARRDSFVFQYAFQDGGPPAPAEFEQALRCWKRPRDPGCDFGD